LKKGIEPRRMILNHSKNLLTDVKWRKKAWLVSVVELLNMCINPFLIRFWGESILLLSVFLQFMENFGKLLNKMNIIAIEYTTYGTKELKKFALNINLIAEGESLMIYSEFVK
jgi:hypothetical protein